jgi:hypothetical protein
MKLMIVNATITPIRRQSAHEKAREADARGLSIFVW